MRRFYVSPSTQEPIRRPFIQSFDGNFEDMSSVASPVPEISTLGLGEISFSASAAKGSFALPAIMPASTMSRSDPLTSTRSGMSSIRSRQQQRAAIRSNPALRMPLAKRLAKSQIERLAKDPNGSVMVGTKVVSDKEEAEAMILRAAKLKKISELRAELREEATERWVYKRAPSSLSKSMSMPGTVFAKPPDPKNMSAKPRPGASFTVEQKRKLRKWFDQLDADGSGEITTDELEDPLLSTGIAQTTADVEALVDEVDKDGSRAIGFAEFLAVLQPGGSPGKPGPAESKPSNLQRKKKKPKARAAPLSAVAAKQAAEKAAAEKAAAEKAVKEATVELEGLEPLGTKRIRVGGGYQNLVTTEPDREKWEDPTTWVRAERHYNRHGQRMEELREIIHSEGKSSGKGAEKRKNSKQKAAAAAAAEKQKNPILQLQKMQDEEALSLDTVICAKRRHLIRQAVMIEMVESVRKMQATEYKYERARLEHDDDTMEELRVLKDMQSKEINERGEFLDAMRRVVVSSYNAQFAGVGNDEEVDESLDKRTPAEKAAERRRQRQLEDMAAAANKADTDGAWNGSGDWYDTALHKAH